MYTLKTDKNNQELPTDILKCIPLNWNYCVWLKYHYSLFMNVPLAVSRHCFRHWLGIIWAMWVYVKYEQTTVKSDLLLCWMPPLSDYTDSDSKVHGANMGPSGADRTQVGPMLAPLTLLSGECINDQTGSHSHIIRFASNIPTHFEYNHLAKINMILRV